MLNELKCDECGRQMALERLEVIDTGEEQPFERIVSLVQQVLHVPICAVSLLDRDRQWFKAKRGLDVDETPRDISFCTHAIRGEVPFIVPDATADSRFLDNPLVTGEAHMRSYLGIPLKTPDGYNIGALCAIDTKPREFQAHEVAILQDFAKVVVDHLELRQIASTDALTGALSRRAWLEKAKDELKLSNRYKRSCAVLVMDLDGFKLINDRFGHLVGDVVIQRFADLAAKTIRDCDLFGRYGGEEFVVMLPEANLVDAEAIAERIRVAFGELVIDDIDGTAHSVSIGIAERQRGEKDLDCVIGRADQALYEAKNAGRNCTVCAGDEAEELTSAVA